MKTETTMFKNVRIIYDNEEQGFVIAKGIWNDEHQEPTIGMRWYDNNGKIGYPQTYGKPQWFVLPKEIGNIIELSIGFSESKSADLLVRLFTGISVISK
jgi:hypothetical protein